MIVPMCRLEISLLCIVVRKVDPAHHGRVLAGVVENRAVVILDHDRGFLRGVLDGSVLDYA